MFLHCIKKRLLITTSFKLFSISSQRVLYECLNEGNVNGHYWSSECLQIECELLYSAGETHPCIFITKGKRKNQSGEILTFLVKITCITVIMTFNMWMPGRSFGIKVISVIKSKISENISNFVHNHTKELVRHTISVVQS